MSDINLLTPLAIIRHGPTDWTADKKLQGRTDIPLSEAGCDMVTSWCVPEELRSRRWIASPLARTQKTAELLIAGKPEIEPRLIEMSYGDWEGLRLNDLRNELGDEMAENEARGLDFCAPNGESPRDVQNRIRPWLMDVHADGAPLVAVAHHGIIRALYAMATGWNMVDRLPQKFRFGEVHHFLVGTDAYIEAERLNESMSPQ